MTLTKGHREEEKNYRIECETKKEKKKGFSLERERKEREITIFGFC